MVRAAERRLGSALLEEILRGLALIAARPHAWPVSAADPSARQFLLGRFPYRIVFASDGDDIVVVAVAHRRRRPRYWRAR